MGLMRILKKLKQNEKEVRILLLGFDNAGKTTIMSKFCGKDVNIIAPTLGFNIETLEFRGYKLTFWDVGGQKSLRSFWRNYFENTDALIWVIDSADRLRLEDCKRELHSLLLEERLAGATLLVFANKQDLSNALPSPAIAEMLDLKNIKTHNWMILPCCAMSGENLLAGMEWLTKDVASRIFTLE
ncbi:ADP-ribosylation factor-like protein 2 [Paramacrobiotus metropolitanus]|uniref:ADP-ribosylation factor-like protein 2 n=1 Tax=Paramacrobiotus metropolitanus TaxID=2943436 RepID=UPI002445E585|nr:ADP-ribosylation factor-like protein 2 [Paramacrobiotus metropolitanus]